MSSPRKSDLPREQQDDQLANRWSICHRHLLCFGATVVFITITDINAGPVSNTDILVNTVHWNLHPLLCSM